MNNHRSFERIICVSSLLAFFGCASSQPSAEVPEANAEAPMAEAAPAASESGAKSVQVEFEPKSDSELSGTGTLTETPEGVSVSLALANVAPGEHGAHVHETGDCSAPDASSAGGHFSPAAHPHGLPSEQPRHLGDLGNISIGADGQGTLEIVAPGANLTQGDPSSFLGKAVIIHAQPDDGGQPSGNAGGRIGCAVIQ